MFGLGVYRSLVATAWRSLSATSVAAGLAVAATAGLSVSLVVGRQLLHRPSVPAHLALPVVGQL